MMAQLIALHMGGIPEAAMVLGPVLLIAAFVRIARRNEATDPEEDDWDADLGSAMPAGATARQPRSRTPWRRPGRSAG